MKYRVALISLALLATTSVTTGCAVLVEDPTYKPLPPPDRYYGTASRIPRMKRPMTEQERLRAQEEANQMRESARAQGLSNQGR
jgi:hypothetical protein